MGIGTGTWMNYGVASLELGWGCPRKSEIHERLGLVLAPGVMAPHVTSMACCPGPPRAPEPPLRRTVATRMDPAPLRR
jgi:hypothetical protein